MDQERTFTQAEVNKMIQTRLAEEKQKIQQQSEAAFAEREKDLAARERKLSARERIRAAGLILMSTPFGKRGFFYEEWITGDEWRRVQITGADCPRMDAEKLEKQKKSMGDMFFRQEYLCEFLDNTMQTFQSGLVEAAMDDTILPLF